MSTILVTGGDGYIGSHCAIALLDEGYDVVIFDNHSTGFASTGKALSEIRSKGKLLDDIEGDLLNPEDIDGAFKKHKIDAVIHFAAFSQVAESMSNPGKYYMNNVAGTMGLLDSMRRNGVSRIVFSSTAATYGEPRYVPIDESHPQEPINPYGRTKLDIEYMMDDYDRAYGIKSVRLRYFNVAGADSRGRVGECHDPETHLIPNILGSTFGDGAEFRMFGTDYDTRDGTCVRDYVNVEDLADAHILALRYLEDGGTTDYFNLGTNEGSTVKEVFAACEKVTGMRIPIRVEGRRPGDPATLVADNKKARKVLGWEPRRSLEDSIRTAYAWERKKRGLTSSSYNS
ncbi:MAG: UDP-glucose 4-epimerase GalE [Candidatus Methanomethylophilaceae archaeon]|nr:UDP-glucose 4-epimerase GalE [Candidatus Methanomethylophilaceae archaeon]MBR4227269.1 UDP-glucose 4-epimerase GalE [Candidatus Methanomethylophilaceae archaeon]